MFAFPIGTHLPGSRVSVIDAIGAELLGAGLTHSMPSRTDACASSCSDNGPDIVSSVVSGPGAALLYSLGNAASGLTFDSTASEVVGSNGTVAGPDKAAQVL